MLKNSNLSKKKKSQKRSQTYHRFVLRFSKVQNEWFVRFDPRFFK